MRSRLLPILLLAGAVALGGVSAAKAASVAYIDGGNAYLSSPDGTARYQLTTGGDADHPWQVPSMGPDGKTVVVHQDAFDGGRRAVLYLYGADGKLATANVMPVYSGANFPVYPIGLDMDWKSQAVAYGYSYCGFACGSSYRGYWLTFSDNQGAYPSNPQGQSDAYFPTFYGERIVSSDSGGSIFVQPDDPNAPFVNTSQGWMHIDGVYLSRAEVAPGPGNLVAVEWSRKEPAGEGIFVGRHQGTVPSDVTDICDLPVNGESSSVSFSPDGTQMTWADADGVKVAGVPNLSAGTGTCTLTSPPVVISSTGKSPSFGGADVPAILQTKGGSGQPGGGQPGGGQPGGAQSGTAKVTVALAGKATRAAFRKGLKLRLTVPAAGRVQVSASIPAKTARAIGLTGAKRSRALAGVASARGIAAAAKSVVVARGSVDAKGAGTVTVRLRPTAKARRAAKRLAGAKLTIKAESGPPATARGAKTIRVKR
jgi:hypothetical protein